MTYSVGTATFGNGSTTVTFAGSGPAPDMTGRKVGDIIAGPDAFGFIAVIDSATQITLGAPWSGASLSGQAYTIYEGAGWASNVDLNANVQSLTSMLRGGLLLLPRDYYSDNLDDRDQYDDVAPPFWFAHVKTGGDVDIYAKLSATTADWSDAVALTGVTGPTGPTGPQGATGPSGVGDKVDVGIFVQGRPQDAELVLQHVFTGAATFSASLTGSRAKAVAASTGTVAFSVKKNGVEFGTITFTASSTGVFAGSAASFAAGDILSITAPASRDATLSDISITLAGTR